LTNKTLSNNKDSSNLNQPNNIPHWKRDLIFEDNILRLDVNLKKYLLAPIYILIGFTIYNTLKGFGGNRYESTLPLAAKLDFPIWLILLLALILFILINLIAKIYLAKSITNKRLIIKTKETIIDAPKYKIKFKHSKCEKYNIKVSKIYGKFFPKQYRIGTLSIKYNGDKYFYVFPIRGLDIEETIKALKHDH
jgi:hypothetical protein